MADELRFTAVEPNATVIFAKNGSPTAYSFKYRTDLNTEWQDYVLDTTLTIPSVGGWIEFKNDTNATSTSVGLSTSASNYYYFTINGKKVAASGNVTSLLPAAGSYSLTKLNDYALCRLFWQCTSLTTAPSLVSGGVQLGKYCYANTFYRCSSLTATPELPAQTLADGCYQAMFQECSALNTVTDLSFRAAASYGCNAMFKDCKSLNQIPDIIATTLASYCYTQMFYGCTALTTAPGLPATTLADHCYREMFQNCTALTTAPELPATALNDYCYYRMFHSCKNLADRPELPALTMKQYCYYEMFANTKITKAGNLPATTLANYCYHGMFRDITSLVETATIAATEMKQGCCQGMYANSAGLRNIAVLDFSHVTKLATDCFREIMVYVPYKEFRMPDCPYVASAYSKICTWGSGGDIYWPYAQIPSGWFDSSGYAQNKTFYYSNPDLDVSAISRDKNGVPADWTIQYLAPKPSLVFSINGRAVASLTINGKAVAKLGA